MAAGASLRVPGFANSQRVADCIDASAATDAALLAAAVLVAAPTAVTDYSGTIAVTASGSMTISAVNPIIAVYSTGNDPYVDLEVEVTFTTGGTASNVVYISTPTTAIAQSSNFAMGSATIDPITTLSYCQVASGNRIAVFYSTLANLTLAAGHRICLKIRYRKV